MCSENGLGAPKTVRHAKAAKEHEAAGAAANDLLTAQLRQLYDSIVQEPIPANLLDLLNRMKP
jgi:hypothetical protein